MIVFFSLLASLCSMPGDNKYRPSCYLKLSSVGMIAISDLKTFSKCWINFTVKINYNFIWIIENLFPLSMSTRYSNKDMDYHNKKASSDY